MGNELGTFRVALVKDIVKVSKGTKETVGIRMYKQRPSQSGHHKKVESRTNDAHISQEKLE